MYLKPTNEKQMKKPNLQVTKAKIYLANNPNVTAPQLRDKFKIPYQTAYNIIRNLGVNSILSTEGQIIKGVSGNEYVTMDFTPKGQEQGDTVNHPPHYKVGGIEVIDFIEAKGFNYRLGNVVKYISRADHKGDRLENLKKAQWYLNREIETLSKS
jgi:hypothetical protein